MTWGNSLRDPGVTQSAARHLSRRRFGEDWPVRCTGSIVMPSIQALLQRWGFVKLRSYGLELTSDGRILSTRPAVLLDDGTGKPVVGWHDGDVAIWKLSPWSEQSAAPPALPDISAGSAAIAPPVAAPVPAGPSARVMRVEVAGEPVVDEDDWEWTIALARARVAVEETESARPPPLARREPAFRAPERPTPRPTAATKDPAASGEWPKTETIGAIDYEDYRIATRPAIEIPRARPPTPAPPIAIPRTTTPSTVIPVPALPVANASHLSRMEPVVRSHAASADARFAKGTGPVDPPSDPPCDPAELERPQRRRPAMVVEDTIPDLSVGDRTTPGIALPVTRRALGTAGESARVDQTVMPAAGDRTRPGIALPPAARTVQLPSIKRRTAPR